VLVKALDTTQLAWPSGEEPNPFVRYRELLHSYRFAVAHGMPDEDYVDLVRRLDKEVEGVDGRGFTVTPFEPSPALAAACGVRELWVKDETGNVSGSHKARHLMGVMLCLEVASALGMDAAADARLAIASCGNAALAAAVVARAAGRPLDVFVPPWAEAPVLARLEALGANVATRTREPGVTGDPTYLALQAAIAGGAVPFTCQGNENGLSIEGGATLAYEMADASGEAEFDRVFVQVGGGALASAIVEGLTQVRDLGRLERLPRLHAVQARGAHPLARAYRRLAERIAARIGVEALDEQARADAFAAHFDAPAVREELRHAATHRSEFMWAWEDEPESVAHGILDDETYDWMAVVTGMLATGGYPVVVDEDMLRGANGIAWGATDIDVDHTGSSGLAGALELGRRGAIGHDERIVVLFTGARRTPEATP